jgi:hypothetical protein
LIPVAVLPSSCTVARNLMIAIMQRTDLIHRPRQELVELLPDADRSDDRAWAAVRVVGVRRAVQFPRMASTMRVPTWSGSGAGSTRASTPVKPYLCSRSAQAGGSYAHR